MAGECDELLVGGSEILKMLDVYPRACTIGRYLLMWLVGE